MNALCIESHIYTIGLRHWIGLIRLVQRNAMKVAFAIVQLHRNLLAQRRKHIDFVRNAFRFDHNLILIKNMQKRAKNIPKLQTAVMHIRKSVRFIVQVNFLLTYTKRSKY